MHDHVLAVHMQTVGIQNPVRRAETWNPFLDDWMKYNCS